MTRDIRIETKDPKVAQDEIERTRTRMSSTLDEIEEVLVRKKQKIQDQLDIKARIREKPLHAAGLVLATGLILGLLTGGTRKARAAIARGADWENRARRLLEIARAQEEELEELQYLGGDDGSTDDVDGDDVDDDYDELDDQWDVDALYPEDPEYEDLEEGPSRGTEKGALTERLADFVAETAAALLESYRSRG